MRIKTVARILSILLILTLIPSTVLAGETDFPNAETEIVSDEPVQEIVPETGAASISEPPEPIDESLPQDNAAASETEPVDSDILVLEAEPQDATDGYAPDDLAVINTLFTANNLSGYTADDPENWDFVSWDESDPKHVSALDLTGKTISGILDLGNLSSLASLTLPDGSVLNIDPSLHGKIDLSYDSTANSITAGHSSAGFGAWMLDGDVDFATGSDATSNPVTIEALGTGSITATIPVTGITLDQTTAAVKKGQTISLTPTVTPADATDASVIWQAGNPNIATVTTDGQVKGIANGTTDITATTTDGGQVATCSVTVTTAATGIKLNKTTANVIKGSTLQLAATISPLDTSNKTVTWASSNPKVATVTKNGLVKGIANGTTTITVATVDGSKAATCRVTVTTAVTGIKLNYGRIVVAAGKANKRLKATILPSSASNKTVTWKSENRKIATIDKTTGVITGVKNGTTTVTATTKDGAKIASCIVMVGTPVKSVALNKSRRAVLTGKSYTLIATLSPDRPTVRSVKWTSSNPSIATVSSTGVVKGIKKGKATITATAKDGSGKKAECIIVVRQAVKSITLNTTSRNVLAGKSYRLKVKTILPADAYDPTVTWSSNNPAVATVSRTGLVKGIKVGTATITAKAADGSGKKVTCTIRVRRPVKSITLNQTVRTVPIGKAYTLQPKTILPDNAYNKNITWASSNPAVATVTNIGQVKGIKNGKAIITATAADGSGVTAQCTIYVGDRVTQIKLNASKKTFNAPGEDYTLQPTIFPSTAKYKAVSWKSSDTAVAKVTSQGVVTAVGPGTATITAKAKDGSAITATCTITVKMTAAELRVYKNLQVVYAEAGTDLYNNYKWVRDHLSYVRRSGHITPPGGFNREQWYAVEGVEQRAGNCYTYAATFAQLAKGLGYDAQYVEGDVWGYGKWQPHGFVLLRIDGATYICDPELEYASKTGRNLYMQPASNPRATYRW